MGNFCIRVISVIRWPGPPSRYEQFLSHQESRAANLGSQNDDVGGDANPSFYDRFPEACAIDLAGVLVGGAGVVEFGGGVGALLLRPTPVDAVEAPGEA